jgi:hypothetical protein
LLSIYCAVFVNNFTYTLWFALPLRAMELNQAYIHAWIHCPLTIPSFLSTFLYNCKKLKICHSMLGTFVFNLRIWKVIQISSTSSSAKIWLINSIWVLIKATFCKPSSIAVLAPHKKRAPLISIQWNFLLGYLSARPTEYSLPQQLQDLDYHFKEISVPLPLKEINRPLLLPLLVEKH